MNKDVLTLAPQQSITVYYELSATCPVLDVLITTENNTGEGQAVNHPWVEYQKNTTSYHAIESEQGTDSYAVKYAEISTDVTPEETTLPVIKHDEISREIHLNNSGAGATDFLTVILNLDNHPQRTSASNLSLVSLILKDQQGNVSTLTPTTITNASSGEKGTFYTYHISLNQPLVSGQEVILIETTKITGTDPFMASSFTSFWGCDQDNSCSEGSTKEVY